MMEKILVISRCYSYQQSKPQLYDFNVSIRWVLLCWFLEVTTGQNALERKLVILISLWYFKFPFEEILEKKNIVRFEPVENDVTHKKLNQNHNEKIPPVQ